MNVLITGGSGFIGQALVRSLHKKGYRVGVLSRDPVAAARRLPSGIQIHDRLSKFLDFAPEAIVNLAGAPIAEGRWSSDRKKALIDSRVLTTQSVVSFIQQLPAPPNVLISASAMGYYGDCGDQDITEEAGPGAGFSSELCQQWEAEAMKAQGYVDRVCVIRIGLVLDQPGGLLDRMVLPFKLGLGGRLGNGRQYMPWIHRLDMVRIIEFLITHEQCQGIFNSSAPNPIRNQEFSNQLATQLRRPQLLPLPASFLKLVFGEMSELMLTGVRMFPKRLLDAGFEFHYTTLRQALGQILGR